MASRVILHLCCRVIFCQFLVLNKAVQWLWNKIAFQLKADHPRVCVFSCDVMTFTLVTLTWPSDFDIWTWPRYSEDVNVYQKVSSLSLSMVIRAQTGQTHTFNRHTERHDQMHYCRLITRLYVKYYCDYYVARAYVCYFRQSVILLAMLAQSKIWANFGAT